MSSANRQTIARKPTAKAAVTNGSVLLNADGRSVWVRRMRDVMSLYISDCGGDDAISEAERSVIRRIAVMTTELERLEASFAGAGCATERELDLYQRTAGNLRRLIESIGMKRRSKDITPHLHDYIGLQP